MEQFLLAPLVLLNLLQKEMDDLYAFDLLQFVVDGGVLANELRIARGKRLRLAKAARPVDLPLPDLLLPQLMLLLIEGIFLAVFVLPVPVVTVLVDSNVYKLLIYFFLLIISHFFYWIFDFLANFYFYITIHFLRLSLATLEQYH